MDPLADLLARGRARGSVFAQTAVGADRGIEFGGRRRLAIHTLLDGDAWFERDGADAVALRAGDLILVPAGAPYRVVAQPGAPVRPHGTEAVAEAAHGRLLCGAYTLEAILSASLVDTLPALVPIRAAAAGPRVRLVLTLMREELAAPGPGTPAVLDRALDLLLALGLRAWFADPDATVPGWYAAMDDPVAGPAIAAMHADPSRAWTVPELAALAGVSRSAFAGRFAQVVGEAPIAYLTGWRMSIAAQALTDEPAATIATVAHRVGYENEYAFATAFRRHFGEPPGRWRRRV
ncbi:AraC family transcriptional regulator [Solirubrobacter pauli]|uniref:AraC family transcriptional regulator n=1 Tax=Solirubrobacter pauli TaxID=166793 RepID=UPI0014768C1B|nr:AraC family transcriptional regulator [Solirubrobacter pauli]